MSFSSITADQWREYDAQKPVGAQTDARKAMGEFVRSFHDDSAPNALKTSLQERSHRLLGDDIGVRQTWLSPREVEAETDRRWAHDYVQGQVELGNGDVEGFCSDDLERVA